MKRGSMKGAAAPEIRPMECKEKENKKKCACPSDDCPRRGICCECVAYHREDGSLPMCLRKR